MKLISHNQVIFEEIIEAKTEWEKIRGLMFRKQKIGCYLETRFGIHSFFVKYPLTIIICDNYWKVVQIGKLKPFGFFFWNPKYRRVIELPYGEYEIKIGENIHLKD